MADMPVWVFLEVIDFGTFVNFYLFCANRWEDNAMLQAHYALKSVKALRNATAHNHCIVNGFTKALTGIAYDTPQVITESLNAAGMPRTKTRRAKLGNVRIAQMAARCTAFAPCATANMRWRGTRTIWQTSEKRMRRESSATA